VSFLLCWLQLLLPLDIDIHSTAPQGTNHHVEVFVTDIVMNVTASSVRTLMATLTSLTAKKVGHVAETVYIWSFGFFVVTYSCGIARTLVTQPM